MLIHVPQFTRRRFLRTLGQGALLAAFPGELPAGENDGDVVTISILHTTDLHGHILPTVDYNNRPDLGGFARCATQIRRWQQMNPNSILLDIGDLYQGTEASLETRGELMVRCLNALHYDGWAMGNHDFDWGMDTLAACIGLSAMPVLSGNALIEGQAPGRSLDSTHPLSRTKPYFIKEVAGFRIAIVGLTTPALSTWLPPENLAGYESLDPAEALRGILLELNRHRPDAIVLAGHMGLVRRDDYANPVGTLTREFPQLVLFLGGHTHQNHSAEWVNEVLYTQADHYGIYAGKADLVFDRRTRRLLRRQAGTVLMDNTVPSDPLVLSLCGAELKTADRFLHREVGELTERLEVSAPVGEASDVERLIGSAILAALRKQGVQIGLVVHGLFNRKDPLEPGRKTVADLWDVLPYENEIVTVDLSHDDLLALAQELANARESRSIMGLRTIASRQGSHLIVTALRAADGSPLSPTTGHRIAFNSYDSQSGGQRFPLLAQLVARPSNRRALYPVRTREALIDFFLTRQRVGKNSLLV